MQIEDLTIAQLIGLLSALYEKEKLIKETIRKKLKDA
jgi:hypothetical protein